MFHGAPSAVDFVIIKLYLRLYRTEYVESIIKVLCMRTQTEGFHIFFSETKPKKKIQSLYVHLLHFSTK